MVTRAQQNDLFAWLAPKLTDKGITILLYVDDIVWCLSHDHDELLISNYCFMCLK
jgi:hypothetical protein